MEVQVLSRPQQIFNTIVREYCELRHHEDKVKILLIITDLAYLPALRKPLSRQGHSICIAYDGHDAIRLIEDDPDVIYDAIICDCGLSEIANHNPITFIEKFPAKSKIILIGDNLPHLKNRSEKDKRTIEFLQKNFSADELLRVLEE